MLPGFQDTRISWRQVYHTENERNWVKYYILNVRISSLLTLLGFQNSGSQVFTFQGADQIIFWKGWPAPYPLQKKGGKKKIKATDTEGCPISTQPNITRHLNKASNIKDKDQNKKIAKSYGERETVQLSLPCPSPILMGQFFLCFCLSIPSDRWVKKLLHAWDKTRMPKKWIFRE